MMSAGFELNRPVRFGFIARARRVEFVRTCIVDDFPGWQMLRGKLAVRNRAARNDFALNVVAVTAAVAKIVS
jgi:hypothetical protein